MEDSEQSIVTRAKAGDADAFRMLVESHSHALFQLAYRMTGNEQDAEDMVQETFLRAYRQLNQFDSRAGFNTWLHRIAVNCSLDLLRKRKRQDKQCDRIEDTSPDIVSTLSSPTAPPDQAILHAEIRQHVTSTLDRLTPMERTAFVLRHFEHQSIDAVGEILGLGDSATKQAIFRAVRKMREALTPIMKATK